MNNNILLVFFVDLFDSLLRSDVHNYTRIGSGTDRCYRGFGKCNAFWSIPLGFYIPICVICFKIRSNPKVLYDQNALYSPIVECGLSLHLLAY